MVARLKARALRSVTSWSPAAGDRLFLKPCDLVVHLIFTVDHRLHQ